MGSRGDEAMIWSILQNFRGRCPTGLVTVVVASNTFPQSEDGRRLAAAFNVNYVYAWRPRRYVANIVRAIREAKATEIYVLGADCMDGKWSTQTSITLLAVADIAARMSLFSRLTAFSWNEHPTQGVLSAFRRISPNLEVLLRDPVSYERFMQDLPDVKAKSVADIAFNLQPLYSDAVKHELDKMNAMKERGRFVLGFNLHSMLVTADKLDAFIGQVANGLTHFLVENAAVDCVLISHDYRDGGDLEVLRKLSRYLDADRACLIETFFSAAELKALTSGLDALFTSRMHLGIAALGMGCPTGAFGYQGKFAGLFQLLGLPESLIVDPGSVEKDFISSLRLLIEKKVTCALCINERLDRTLALSRQNLK